MFDLNAEDMLSKVHQYKLDRPDGWCYIAVHEIIASGSAEVHFIAVPNLVVLQTEQEYFGTVDTAEDALADCLKKIKSVDIKSLFPNIDEAYETPGAKPEANE